ncbi:type I-D CRISPR-associated protein Cas7/Csc2 [Methanosarcina sp. 2.H.A.1B.4]|uniref:type I-D CRISPR-associated protein Cas7/Csc2 n=1 Tax=Methanosarcina sp. 2.H.A.1B.4 TaxID=1483600 RepID=UPI00062247BF|nr:type I-D CRISPR-associated protein Cas7/Csc2 [Methanosarcina sp. 2.H.A.1B.4]KKG11217.1 CRISPR-associated protein Csc2 [Methanosarcina sp. 2.H.A.1B.4]
MSNENKESQSGSIEKIKKELSPGLVESLINEPSAHYIHILLLRELQSNAIFTTNGEDADIATVGISAEDGLVDYSPVMMFKRKQTGSDRRKGKELQRNFLGITDTMDVNKMNQESPESMLYGSAAGENAVSVTSRVMYDTAYSIRDSSVIIEEKFQNAPGDNFAKGPTSAIREPDFIIPGTLFPCVVTLRDATFEELLFVLGITKMNKRYGAVTSRIGRMQNHILGIYSGIEEGTANLVLSQEVARRLAIENGKLNKENLNHVLYSPVLDVEKVKTLVKQAFDEEAKTLSIEPLGDHDKEKLLEYTTSETLKEALECQKEKASTFFHSVSEKPPKEKKSRGKK